jgi:hypothetical protein
LSGSSQSKRAYLRLFFAKKALLPGQPVAIIQANFWSPGRESVLGRRLERVIDGGKLWQKLRAA